MTFCSEIVRTAASQYLMPLTRPAPIDIVAPATNGFLRATMRGLARQRLRQDADREVPFRLTEWADGRLTLEDPTTGRRVEMEAFGITNEEVFAGLLTAKEGS